MLYSWAIDPHFVREREGWRVSKNGESHIEEGEMNREGGREERREGGREGGEGGGSERQENKKERGGMRMKKCTMTYVFMPFQMNLGGASDRPVSSDIWTIVQLKMDGQASEEEIQHAYTRVRRRGICSVCSIL